MADVAACRADVDKVAEAHLREAVELSIASREIVSTAMSISVGIAEDEGFWDRESSTRGRVLAVYDALQALVAELTEPAGAVA